MTPDPQFSLEMTTLFHLVALKYAMAGDMESDELLRQLETRWRLVNWTDPEFIKFSDAMRNGPPHLVHQGQESTTPQLKAMVHDQGELLAGFCESAALIVAQHREAQKKLLPAIEAATNFMVYVKDLLDLHVRMRDRLQEAGEDTSVYKLPPLPFPSIT
jgi:hypothetical protein